MKDDDKHDGVIEISKKTQAMIQGIQKEMAKVQSRVLIANEEMAELQKKLAQTLTIVYNEADEEGNFHPDRDFTKLVKKKNGEAA